MTAMPSYAKELRAQSNADKAGMQKNLNKTQQVRKLQEESGGRARFVGINFL
jgi:hypothetical protein